MSSDQDASPSPEDSQPTPERPIETPTDEEKGGKASLNGHDMGGHEGKTEELEEEEVLKTELEIQLESQLRDSIRNFELVKAKLGVERERHARLLAEVETALAGPSATIDVERQQRDFPRIEALLPDSDEQQLVEHVRTVANELASERSRTKKLHRNLKSAKTELELRDAEIARLKQELGQRAAQEASSRGSTSKVEGEEEGSPSRGVESPSAEAVGTDDHDEGLSSSSPSDGGFGAKVAAPDGGSGGEDELMLKLIVRKLAAENAMLRRSCAVLANHAESMRPSPNANTAADSGSGSGAKATQAPSRPSRKTGLSDQYIRQLLED